MSHCVSSLSFASQWSYLTGPHWVQDLWHKPSPCLLNPRLHNMTKLETERGKTTAKRGYSNPASKHGSSSFHHSHGDKFACWNNGEALAEGAAHIEQHSGKLMTKAARCLSDMPLPVHAHHRVGRSKLSTAQVMCACPQQPGPGGVQPQLQLQQADTHVPTAVVLQPQAAPFQPRAAGTPAPYGSSAEVQAVTAPSAASYEIFKVFCKGRSEQCVDGKLHGLLYYGCLKFHADGGKRASAAQCIVWAKGPATFMTLCWMHFSDYTPVMVSCDTTPACHKLGCLFEIAERSAHKVNKLPNAVFRCLTSVTSCCAGCLPSGVDFQEHRGPANLPDSTSSSHLQHSAHTAGASWAPQDPSPPYPLTFTPLRCCLLYPRHLAHAGTCCQAKSSA